MNLYRHHPEAFNAKILASKKYLLDTSQSWNYEGGKKNLAHFFFYAADLNTVKWYSDETTILYKYSTDARLLNLRKKEERKLLTAVIAAFIKDEEGVKSMMRNEGLPQYQNAQIHKVTTSEDIINDLRVHNISFWGERCSNGEIGLLLKKELVALGFDGVIFSDGVHNEVALMEKAKPSECHLDV